MRPIIFFALNLCLIPVFAQHWTLAANNGNRILAIVPLTGAGTYSDPKRPLLAPVSKEQRDTSGVRLFRWEPSDDGKFAIVEFETQDLRALQNLSGDAGMVKAFASGKSKRDEIEKEVKKYKKDFSFGPDWVKK